MREMNLDEIIAQIPSGSTVALSALAPVDLVERLQSEAFDIQLLDTTLHGTINHRSLPSPDKPTALIITGFFGSIPDMKAIQEKSASLGYTPYLLESVSDANRHPQSLTVMKEILKSSKDLSFDPACSGRYLAIFLEPYLFCPKEGILERFREEGILFQTDLNPLYKRPEFEKQRANLYTAHECYLGFIALDSDIPEEKARQSAQKILAVLDENRLRRCSF